MYVPAFAANHAKARRRGPLQIEERCDGAVKLRSPLIERSILARETTERFPEELEGFGLVFAEQTHGLG